LDCSRRFVANPDGIQIALVEVTLCAMIRNRRHREADEPYAAL
jgi:hypothetical protein